jgi:hypothetical protein
MDKGSIFFRVHGVTIQMTDVQVCIPPEDDPEIGSKHVVIKNRNNANIS